MRTILAIDPGPEQSAWLAYRDGKPAEFDIERNGLVRARIAALVAWRSEYILAVEMVHNMGMPAGQSVMDTAFEAGRFVEAWQGPYRLIYRKDVKMHLCGSMRAKDPNVRQALIDRYPRTGGGKVPQIGTKKQPGPLYGMRSHLWAALGVAVTCEETVLEKEETC